MLDNNTDGIVDGYLADISSQSDYYAGGMAKPGRQLNPSSYKFGFNGMESDNEIKGTKNSYDFGARMYDPRLVRWFSVDPVTHPWQSPYNAFDGNPIYFNDPDGGDAKVTIKGRNITVKTKIYIYGSGATAAQARRMQNRIMRDWNRGHWTYTDKKTGKKYNVSFEVDVELYDESDPTNVPSFIPDSYNPFSRNNYIEVAKTQAELKTSYVRKGDEGRWRGYGSDPSSHEYGHLLGLDDQYIKGQGAKQGWEGNIMAEPAEQGKVEQKNIDDILNPIMQEYREAGSPVNFNIDINPSKPGWEHERMTPNNGGGGNNGGCRDCVDSPIPETGGGSSDGGGSA